MSEKKPEEHINKSGQMTEEKKHGEAHEEIDENLMDSLADDLEEKLNLTAGKRDKEDDELDPEMDKMFENFMQKVAQDPESGAAMKEMSEMMKGMKDMDFGRMFGDAAGAGDGPEDAAKFDKMTDMLLHQFMDKDILYEPLQSAQTEIKSSLEKGEVDPKDREQMEAQLKIIGQLIETFDKDPANKEKIITLFEEMNKVGSFIDILKKYSSQFNEQQGGLGDLSAMFGGGPGGMGGLGAQMGPGGPGKDDECRLI